MSFFFQAEDGIRDLVRSRGLGDVYKRQDIAFAVKKTHKTGSEIDAGCKTTVAIPVFRGDILSLIHI